MIDWLIVVIVFKLWCRKELLAELQEQQISAQKVLFNLSGEKDRTARLAGLVPVMQQWHKKKVENLLSHDWNIWPFCSARSWDILPTFLLAGSLRHTRHSCLYGDLLSVQAGELCIMDDTSWQWFIWWCFVFLSWSPYIFRWTRKRSIFMTAGIWWRWQSSLVSCLCLRRSWSSRASAWKTWLRLTSCNLSMRSSTGSASWEGGQMIQAGVARTSAVTKS